jgi:hypothetical protein
MPKALLNRSDEISDSHVFMPEPRPTIQTNGITLDYPFLAPSFNGSGRNIEYVSDFIQ